MSPDGPHSANHAQARASHLMAFLKTRGLALEDLAADARARIGAGEVFFVSTAVHGLAGSTSDIDIIVVSPARADDTARISTMAFAGGSRLGIKNYGREEVAESIAYLADLSQRTASEIWQGVTTWRAPVPFVDLERLINGLRDDLACPYAHRLPDLCGTRFSYSFGLFRQAIIFCCVAQRAGETRAPWAYLLHGLPHLMDVILSCEGNVLTNTKWTTQRWAMSKAAKQGQWRVIDDWWERAWKGLRSRSAPPESVDALSLYERCISALGLALDEDHAPLAWRGDLVTVPFSEGVHLTKDNAGRIVLHERGELSPDYTMEELCRLERSDARSVLACMRADFAQVRLGKSELAQRGKALFLESAT